MTARNALPAAALLAAMLAALAAAPARPGAAAEADEARLREAARLRAVALADMEDGNFGRARASLEALAEILPDNVLPPINLAICLYRLNDVDAAHEQIARARRLDPDNPQMLYTLARLLESDPGARELWREVVDHFTAVRPGDARPEYLRALAAVADGRHGEAVAAFRRAQRRDPENLVVLVEMLVAAAEGRDAEGTADALDAIEDRLDGFEGNVADYAERLRERLDGGDLEALRPAAMVLRNLLRPTELYQIGLVPLTGSRGGGAGALFPQLDFDPPLPKSIQGGQDIEVVFEPWAAPELERAGTSESLAPARGGERDELVARGAAGAALLAAAAESLERRPLALEPAPRGRLLSYDVDQDGLSDLLAAAPGFGVRLYPGRPDGGYGPALLVAPLAAGQTIAGVFPLDVDHDGDLDLFVARPGAEDLYLQNNGDGSWAERAAELGIAGAGATLDVASADLDDDGDLDLLTVDAQRGPRLYLNRRAGAFDEASGRLGLDAVGAGFAAARIADFDLDGRFDLLLSGPAGGRLLLARGAGFEPAGLPAAPPGAWTAAEIGDWDNDGDPDVALAIGERGDLVLLRNRRERFEFEPAGRAAGEVAALVGGDLDEDGDLDLAALRADGALRLWRNEGGNRNQWLRLRLVGKNDNSAKNNTQALFTRIEARAGDAYQLLLGNGGFNHLGLGAARQADVIRVVWTNGVAQSWPQTAAKQVLVEEQVLKGSCPFLYAWNGDSFEFVTDLMWSSPLGMVQADGSAAPHQAARDWVLVPGEALRPVGGELWLQTTAELWETVYLDRQQLLAVDHPAEVEVVVDERFLPPPYPRAAPLHAIGRRLAPVAARDHEGRDVLDRLLERDGVYVDELPLTRYQGLTHGQSLELTFDGVPAGGRLRLLLWGWIFPTDSSINFALAQDSGRSPAPPRLELLAADGSWELVSPFVGLPNGKRKAMVVELTDRLPAGRVTLRLGGSLQIYWDAARLALGEPPARPVVTALEPAAADLHYRGFSELYRESASGPHLFDYGRVSVEPRFPPMRGRATRYGPVGELLAREDDRYVVMAPGDELTVRFDGAALPPLPTGWRRDWVLYTGGWVKDADLHTTHSQTVEPLPYHGMAAYPDLPRHAYPRSAAHRDYLRRYQTRRLDEAPFREAVRDTPAARLPATPLPRPAPPGGR